MTTQTVHAEALAVYQAMPKKALTEFMVDHFHEKHRAQLPDLINLARKIEDVHNDHGDCPAGLSDHLQAMYQELESHMMKEEQILFPMLAGDIYPKGPIAVMEEEHDQHEQMIAQLLELTNQCNAPRDACGSWIMLYEGINEFVNDLHQHIAIENAVLFKQPEQKSSGHGNGHCCGGCQ
ncbi:hemerythrin domain-containing protein [Pseudidiomarina woesei]|uniref:Hemerythrin HHE cation binding domain n=1 Tax=Pseudidiomarina woesei TaxID=1381080 RepID=A0A0K6H5J9_9GAMM|nr:hemerythrin domain-containing protein [Pseudidiomarina woesei]CUA86172.1 Hemerythrin HHE cation binding domain [Pseudidiomarina woesei]